MTGSAAAGVAEGVRRRPGLLLTPYVRRYEAYRLEGFRPGVHLGMPAPEITVVVGISRPVELSRGEGLPPDRFDTLAGGLSTRPVPIVHDGNQHGIQLSLTRAWRDPGGLPRPDDSPRRCSHSSKTPTVPAANTGSHDEHDAFRNH